MSDIRVFVTSYGRPALRRLHERVAAAKADDPLRRVTVVVPTNYVGVSTRRLLASGALGPITARGNGVAGLSLLTVYRLAELLGTPRLAAEGRRPVSTPVITAAVRQVLRADPGVFASVRDHPATEEALVRAHRELSEVRSSSLDTLAAASRRSADVVRIHRAVRDVLAPAWFTEVDLMAAAEAAIAAGSPVTGDLGTVVVYLPQDLSIAASGLLRAVASSAAVEVIAARTGVPEADADIDRSLRRLGASVPDELPAPAPATVDAVVSASDPAEEVSAAVQRLIAASRRGVPLERIAVVYPSPEPYARILHEQLRAATVPYNGAAVRPLADRLVGRWVLDLLRLPDRRFDRPSVLGLLTSAPVRGDGSRPLPTGAWERISRDAGVVRDRQDWTRKLARFADVHRRRAEAEQTEETPREWLVDRLCRDADRAESLRRFVGRLFDELHTASSLDDWDALSRWCKDMVTRHLGTERDRVRWPEHEREAADRVDAALDRLSGLGAVEPHTDLATFRRTLQLELDDDLGRVGQFGHGVLVGTPPAVLGVDLDVVIVLGLAEGVFPTRPHEDSLLPDAERRIVADELPPRDQRVGVEHRHLLAALAAARSERVVTYPRGDLRRSIERPLSRWLSDAVQLLQPDAADPRRLPDGAEWLQWIPSFAGRVRSAKFPANEQEYRLRALAEHRGRRFADHPLVAGDAGLVRSAAAALAFQRAAFDRFSGHVPEAASDIASPVDRVISASQLETWLSCPHAYLMQYVLKVEPVENPEELLAIPPMELGSLVHDILERWLCDELVHGLPAPEDAWSPAARERLFAVADAACREADGRGVTGHPLLWRRDRRRLWHDLERFLDEDAVRRRSEGLVPLAAERPFGMPGTDNAPLGVDLGDGRTLRLRGRIDRLDRATDAAVVVADYKTGSSSRFDDLKPETPLGDGTKLQLPIYGLAVRDADPEATAVRSEYWFVSTKGGWARVGYSVTDEVAETLRAALRTVVDGIEGGVFPQRPPAPGWRPFVECAYCDPDGLGTGDRHRQWERLREAPALRPYVQRVEPEALAQESA